MFNFSTRKVGGLRFFKLGRLCISFCVTREYRAFGNRIPRCIPCDMTEDEYAWAKKLKRESWQ